MKRRSVVTNFATASAVSLIAPILFVAASEKPHTDYTITSESRLVVLDVSVNDSHAQSPAGLSKENFSISENGRPQKISVFDNRDAPVSVGILVDESSSMSPKRAHVIAAAQTFIEESNPHDEVFVLNFNDRVVPGLPPGVLFSDDPSQLRAALHRGVAAGKTALNDAIVDGLRQLEHGRQDKKTLVLISDGGDNASVHTRREMLDLVERSIATIYTIGLFDPDDEDRDPRLLERLARMSGGVVYLPKDISDMVPVCRKIAKDIRSRYTLGYVPPVENGRTPVRHIQVRVSAPGYTKLVARTRGSYRYDPIPGTEGRPE